MLSLTVDIFLVLRGRNVKGMQFLIIRGYLERFADEVIYDLFSFLKCFIMGIFITFQNFACFYVFFAQDKSKTALASII